MRRHPTGWTVLEVSVVVSAIATAVVMFLPAFLDRLQVSKFDEVDSNLASLAAAAQAYYQATHTVHGSHRTRCLPVSAGPAPLDVGAVPVDVDYAADATPGAPTWRALGFQPALPVRFRYSVLSAVARCGVQPPAGELMVRVVAEGDLDGDGTLSRFTRTLIMGEDGALADGAVLRVVDRTE